MENSSTEFDFVDNGGVTSPLGFRACGITAGLKRSGKPDFALVASDSDCSAAGTFTSNLFPAAPVRLCRERIAAGLPVRAVVAHSGVANACTGEQGYRDACLTAKEAAACLKVPETAVLVTSTGRIGVQLPMEKVILPGVRKAVTALARDGGSAASEAIMTTDTRPKQVAVRFRVNGKTVTIGGMTKGAGMISPRMLVCRPHATMLCYLTTDAAVSKEDLATFLTDGVDVSFNRISVDNDMSTNDTCLLLANGASGVAIHAGTPEGDAFRAALTMVMQHLAKAMVLDGEGVSKFITVEVRGAATADDAEKCARAIADSMLCKTAWFGNDPNWGRVLAAAGYSGAAFSPENVSLDYDEMPVVRGGMDAGTPESRLCEVVKRRSFRVLIDLGEGVRSAIRWTSDLTHDYVTINADYHT